MGNDNPYRRRQYTIRVTVHDDDVEGLGDALLAVADLLDTGNVSMSMGPADHCPRESDGA